MLDNDNLTYSYRKTVAGNSAERSLITLERSQKLDLLIHLLTNLRQALIVCGPEGIGKTTLLQTLQTNRKDQWRICLLQGSSNLSFESIVIKLSDFLNLGGSSIGFDLSSLRACCEKQKVVLIVDDAGELVPGLIGELVDFSESLPGLRLVFSMTYDEFHIKSASDKAVDDCHFIELPPLSLKQCTEYLQNLTAQPGAMLSFNAITDNLVADLYRETHGIPGKILAEIPKFNHYQNRKKNRLGLWLGVAAITIVAGWAMKNLLPPMPAIGTPSGNLPKTAEPANVALATAPKIAGIETALPTTAADESGRITDQTTPLPQKPEEIKTGIAATPAAPLATPNSDAAPDKAVEHTETAARNPDGSETGVTPQADKSPEPAAPAAGIEPPTPDSQASALSPPKTVAQRINKTPETKSEKPSAKNGDQDWIMAQPAGNYTLQIIALSNKAAADSFLKKYAKYGNNLKYYRTDVSDQEKYVVIYGSFQSAAEAKKRKAALPNEFKRSLEKSFKSIRANLTMKSVLLSTPVDDAASNKPMEIVESLAPQPAMPPNIAGVEKVLPATETNASDRAADRNPALQLKPEEVKTDMAIAPAPPLAAPNSNATSDKTAENIKAATSNPVVSETGVTPQTNKSPEPAAPAAGMEPPTPDSQASAISPPKTPLEEITKTPEPKTEIRSAENGNQNWIMAQPAGNYTLQVMVLSNKAAADRFLKKYAEYGDSLKYYTISKNDEEKYVLIYGSFQSIADAKKRKAAMPNEFKGSLEKQFKSIRKENSR